MNNYDDMDKKDKFHMFLVVQLWEKIAGLVYGRYKKEGRGVVVMVMLDCIPVTLAHILPPPPNYPKTSAHHDAMATAYVPRDELLTLENIIGEQGVLKLDFKLGEYDPDTTIVFAMIETEEDEKGTKAVAVSGFEVTPPYGLRPAELYRKGAGFGEFNPFNPSKNNPLLTLN
jgi:hypothetical protein